MIRALIVVISMLGASMLSACEKSTVDVNLHGVNYTDNSFSYVVMDPDNPAGGAGGELIDPFGAGGTMCCAKLPRKWRQGIKLQVRTIQYLQQRPAETVVEAKKLHVVEVPKYINGTPGELWVLLNADESVSVVSSDFQPDHARWPGKIRGWPVPSLEYRRERWELLRKHEEMYVKIYLDSIEEMARNPEKYAQEAWEYSKKNRPKDLLNFSSPNDPKYLELLRRQDEEGLELSKRSLKNLMDARP
jgi:hypothetical protein